MPASHLLSSSFQVINPSHFNRCMTPTAHKLPTATPLVDLQTCFFSHHLDLHHHSCTLIGNFVPARKYSLHMSSHMPFACKSKFCQEAFEMQGGLSLHRKKCPRYKIHEAIALKRRREMAKVQIAKCKTALDAVRLQLRQKSSNMSKPYYCLVSYLIHA